MSQSQTLKTLIHEIAHAKLHALPVEDGKIAAPHEKDRHTREVEAESVAYVVCQHFGIDTSDYSFGYVAGWSKGRELSELKTSLGCIRNAAAEIIGGIEAKCPELAPPEPELREEQPKPRRKPGKRKIQCNVR
jgi:antirestriction protein ArdC